MKQVWLITHDNYIDRRIFFFSDYFAQKGYDVKLFASAYFDDTGEAPFIKRPHEKVLWKEFDLPFARLPEPLREALEKGQKAQERYRADKSHYAPFIGELKSELEDPEQTLPEETNLYTYGTGHVYILAARTAKHEARYDSLTGQYSLIHLDVPLDLNAATGMEVALADTLRQTSEPGARLVYGQTNTFRYLSPEGKMTVRAYAGLSACEVVPETGQLYQLCMQRTEPDLYDEQMDALVGGPDFQNRIFDFRSVFNRVKQETDNPPEIVYVADLPCLPVGVLLKKLFGCKLVVDCHEWWARQCRLWNKENTELYALIDSYEKRLYPYADLLVTVGQSLARAMGGYFGLSFGHVYSCVTAALTGGSGPQNPYRQLGVPPGGKVALFQGSLTTLRNLDNLARATRWLKETQYLVICGGGAYEESFREILKAEGNPGRVIFAGWIAQSELMRYTCDADLGILPYVAVDDYYALSFPNKVMEYFNAALPVVYDNSLAEIRHLATLYGVGLGADCRDPQALGTAVSGLLDDAEQLCKMRAGYEKCAGLFGPERQGQLFEKQLCEAGMFGTV